MSELLKILHNALVLSMFNPKFIFLYVAGGITLKLRGRFELDEMRNHPLFTIVFLLEYMVNIPVSQPEVPAGRKAKNKVCL